MLKQKLNQGALLSSHDKATGFLTAEEHLQDPATGQDPSSAITCTPLTSRPGSDFTTTCTPYLHWNERKITPAPRPAPAAAIVLLLPLATYTHVNTYTHVYTHVSMYVYTCKYINTTSISHLPSCQEQGHPLQQELMLLLPLVTYICNGNSRINTTSSHLHLCQH